MLDRMCKRQWKWTPRGWFILLTFGGAWGLGFMVASMRYNGVDFYFGPLVLTIQPPMPTVGDLSRGGSTDANNQHR